MRASFYEEKLPPDLLEVYEDEEIEEAGDKDILSVIEEEEAPEVDE